MNFERNNTAQPFLRSDHDWTQVLVYDGGSRTLMGIPAGIDHPTELIKMAVI